MDLRSTPVGQVAPPPVVVGDLRASRRYCRDLTRREARNFYWGFIALPRDQRTAIYALYGFARQVDDDVDLRPRRRVPACRLDGPTDEVLARHFQEHRARLDDCFAGRAGDPVMHVLAEIIPRYRIPREELEAIVRGVEMDTRITRYESWAELQEYCRLVASSVGRMCVRIFGFSESVALQYADDLGMAMQLTNILRDVREDLELGRIYLPQSDLRAHGVHPEDLLSGSHNTDRAAAGAAAWDRLIAFEVCRAEELFSSGLRVVDAIPRRAGVCVLTMAGMYQQILREIKRDPHLPLRRRASLNPGSKLAVMARSWLQAV